MQEINIAAGKYFFGDPEEVLNKKDWKHTSNPNVQHIEG